MITTERDIQYVAIQMDNGAEYLLGFVVRGASPTLPFGASWTNEQRQSWSRPATDANVFAEITKSFPSVNQLGESQPQPTSWERISHEERDTRRVDKRK
jgi:hypothetical protein